MVKAGRVKYIQNCDCIEGARKYLDDKSVYLMICDPPFGIGESKFDQHYNRDARFVTDGYVEAPENYERFTVEWLSEAKRVLKDNGSMYVISSWNRADIVGSILRGLGFNLVNKIIWHFSFGPHTTRKFVSSHYEIFFVSKSKKARITFNNACRYGSHQRGSNGNSLQNEDMQDVWCINKENQPGQEKNLNKLPEELIKKMIQYSSNEGDIVCDFFLGNFTTAVVAKKLKRVPCGFEINKNGFQEHIKKLEQTEGQETKPIKDYRPANRGKKWSKKETKKLCEDFRILSRYPSLKQRDIIRKLTTKFKRGRFSIEKQLKEQKLIGNNSNQVEFVPIFQEGTYPNKQIVANKR